MPFTTLFSAPCLSVDYDVYRNCFALNLWGQLKVLSLQDLSQVIVGLPLASSAWCLAQDNLVPTQGEPESEDWLLNRLLPALHQAGVQRWAWVCRPTPRSWLLAEKVAKRLPQTMLIIFNDLEDATTWLQRFC